MKYEAPYGVSDPNAAYINGNPSTGTMGSIPPAASIENPQREIVNTISDTNLIVPTDADLHQLSKAIQGGQLNFKHDTGVANSYAASMSPDPGSYFEGLSVVLKILNTNTGPSVLNLNSHGNAPVVRTDGSPVVGGGILAGSYVKFLYDGANFRTVWSSAAVAGMPVWLTAPKTFYVNGTTGNDNYDGTAPTFTTGITGPFKTLQRAANEYPKYDLNGYTVSIYVADGSYTKVSCPIGNGSGAISWIGNTGSFSACTITAGAVGGSAVTCAGAGPPIYFNGFEMASGTAIPGDPGFGVWSVQGASVVLNGIAFGPSYSAHIACSEGAMTINGPIIIAGNAQTCLDCDGGRVVLNAVTPPPLTVQAAVNFNEFVYITNVGRIVGPWGAITGFANVTGEKYNINGNGILNTTGQGTAAWPGNLAGALSTGGQAF